MLESFHTQEMFLKTMRFSLGISKGWSRKKPKHFLYEQHNIPSPYKTSIAVGYPTIRRGCDPIIWFNSVTLLCLSLAKT